MFIRREFRSTLPRHSLIATIPHSGEQIPPEAQWLMALPERLLMFDVDRFVDQLYEPALDQLSIPTVVTPFHRYACDLNRLESDIDQSSVVGATAPRGAFARGLHWSMTTLGEPLMPRPIGRDVHRAIVDRCFHPFHDAVRRVGALVRSQTQRESLYHLDLHSMPSFGTSEHRDPGSWRPDMVISNQDGKSSSPVFFERVCEAAGRAGFSVARNWPYKGGRITEVYGRPDQRWETVQVELNRKLYMFENNKRINLSRVHEMQVRLGQMLDEIVARLP